jgi:hypothetical protein
MRADSGFWSAKTIRACRRHQLRYSVTVRQTTPIRAAIAAIAADAWVDIVYPEGGLAPVAETRYQGDRLIVRRTRLTGAQAELFPTWRYHAFVTDQVGTTVELDQDHRSSPPRHGRAVHPRPQGRGRAAAPPVGQVQRQRRLAGDRHPGPQPAALGRRHRAGCPRGAGGGQDAAPDPAGLPGRITHSARRWTLHLPVGWPWAAWFALALARLRCVATPPDPRWR